MGAAPQADAGDIFVERDADLFAAPDAAPQLLSDASSDGDAAPLAPCITAGCAITWREQMSFALPIFDHTSFVIETAHGARLVIVGGLTRTEDGFVFLGGAMSAPILADGSLGAWMADRSDERFGIEATPVVDGQDVYLIGGKTPDEHGGDLTASTLHLHFDDGGAIDSVQTCAAEFPTPVNLSGASLLNGKIVVTGGEYDQQGLALATTFIAERDESGDITRWNAGPSLPKDRSRHTSIVHDGRIYLLGGMRLIECGLCYVPEDVTEILRSTLDGAGNVIGWENLGSLATIAGSGILSAGGVSHGGSLWLVGGMLDDRMYAAEHRTVAVQRIPVYEDDTIGESIIATDPLPVGRGDVSAGTPIYGNHIYVVGGFTDDLVDDRIPVPLSRIFVGTFR